MSKEYPIFDALGAAGSKETEGSARFRRAGSFVFVSGVGSPESTGIQAQTNACITELASVLEEANGGLENLVEVTTYLARMTDYTGYNDAYGKRFSADGPARTTVAVNQLTYPESLIEMRGIAFIANGTNTLKDERKEYA